jgi:hypothetical protein
VDDRTIRRRRLHLAGDGPDDGRGPVLAPPLRRRRLLRCTKTGQLPAALDGSGFLKVHEQGTATISGTVTANAGSNLNTSALALDATITGRLPAGSTPANGESNAATISRLGSFNFIFNGATWDRWTGAVTGTVTANQGTANATPWNENLAQVAGATVATGHGTAAGALRVELPTDGTGVVVVTQATAANLNLRTDTSGATGSAVPARADYVGLSDGTNTVGSKAASASTLTTQTLTGAQIATPVCTWAVNNLPAAATKATVSQAAVAAVRHVASFYAVCFAAGATAGPVQTWTIRDGATGAGTVKWGGALAAPANDSTCIAGQVSLVGTANTAMTIEFGAAGAATTIETVSLCGYDVQ